MADLFLLQPNSLDDWMLQTLAASDIRDARTFSENFSTQDSSDIGQ